MVHLAQLLSDFPCEVSGFSEVEITDIVSDSRKVRPGALFAAFQGVHHDGNRFIDPAVAQGARAILTDQAVTEPRCAVVRVPDVLRALAHISVRFWDYPSRRLLTIGITGTNGKTTTTYLVEAIFQKAGWDVGVMGTINYRFKDQLIPAPNTTPYPHDLQRFLASVVSGGGRACVMEVSSHALALGRVDGVEFDVGVFTNLTQDHLDFHQTLEAYGAAKAKLFDALGGPRGKSFPQAAILNRDDPWAEKMPIPRHVPTLNYRLHGPADVFTKHLLCDARGSHFELHGPGASFPVELPLLGEFNVMNALAAATVAFSQKIEPAVIRAALESFTGVPGRMERVSEGQPFTVVVDYAHTEDALSNVLEALRALRPARILTVFGCGGDRDRTKRPLMGEAAARRSDHVFVTTDNPRSEDASRITLDIEVGLRRSGSSHYDIVLDRAEAIRRAIAMAQPEDIVLIAGKGHETYQIVQNQTLPFDDREVARQSLRSLSIRS